MKIIGDRLRLRPITEADLEKLRVWRNKYKDNFFTSKFISPEQQDKWWKNYKLNPPGTTVMLIAKLFNGDEIGTISLDHINIDDRSAEVGHVLLLEDYRSHGYAQEMVETISDFAFKTMRLHRIYTETDIANDDAISIYHKVGFRIIGMRFHPIDKFTYRIIAKMERVNPDHDMRHPVVLLDLEDE